VNKAKSPKFVPVKKSRV